MGNDDITGIHRHWWHHKNPLVVIREITRTAPRSKSNWKRSNRFQPDDIHLVICCCCCCIILPWQKCNHFWQNASAPNYIQRVSYFITIENTLDLGDGDEDDVVTSITSNRGWSGGRSSSSACGQCDQIGWFSNVDGNKFSNKSYPNI